MPASRSSLYFAAVIAFALTAIVLAFRGSGDARTLYVCSLFALCATPLWFVKRWNGRDAILCVFLATYFVFYGALDVVSLASNRPRQPTDILTLTEATVLLGALLVIAGYRLGTYTKSNRPQAQALRDWRPAMTVLVGLAIWGAGTASIWIWQVHFQRNGVEFDASIGSTAINIAVLGRMVQPIGVLMLAYAYFSNRSRPLLLVLLGVLAVQLLVGFIGDSKELGMRSALLVLMTAFLVRGRVPVVWLAGVGLFVAVAFPVFQAYRAEIIMARGESRADAAKDIMRSIKLALASKDKVASGNGFAEERAQSFLERASLKGNLELILTRVGDDVRFQEGATIAPLFTVFIPRIIWPNKPDSSSGQLFNTEFRISEDPRTYISPTQLGEMYWNFGWTGILIGMPLLGFVLGCIGVRCDLTEHRSLTRLLVLVTTIYAACVRFEGSIALEYTLWLRSIAVIALLHWMFARAVKERAVDATADTTSVAPAAFANLMR